MGEELEFASPDLMDFEVYGTEDIKDTLYTPPPFIDLEELVKPE